MYNLSWTVIKSSFTSTWAANLEHQNGNKLMTTYTRKFVPQSLAGITIYIVLSYYGNIQLPDKVFLDICSYELSSCIWAEPKKVTVTYIPAGKNKKKKSEADCT